MVRKIEHRTAVNKNRRTRMRTFVRKVEEAIASGDQSVAKEALKSAEPEIMRAVSKGILHKNTASRKVSRLSSRVAKMGA
jgi:small subunit ribosomal protein S20